MLDAALEKILQVVFAAENRPRFDFANGGLYRYYGWLENPRHAERFVRGLSGLLTPVWEKRRTLRFLDVGCGYGMSAVVLAVYGARSIQGIEAEPGCIKTCHALKNAFPDLPVQFIEGRAETLPFEDRSVDVVLSIEAISHFVEPWQFLTEAWRVLAPGGVLILSDDNNGANLFQRRQLEEIWERFENGPPTQHIHGHRVQQPYIERRRTILSTHFPQANAPELALLSERTSGLWGEALIEAGRGYFSRQEIPDSVYQRGTCPIDPLSGAFMENLLDPRDIGACLHQRGALVDVRPYFGGESRGGSFRLVDTVIRKTLPRGLTLRFAPGFRVYAWKEA
jgi:SAM-dependent methyltransferase